MGCLPASTYHGSAMTAMLGIAQVEEGDEKEADAPDDTKQPGKAVNEPAGEAAKEAADAAAAAAADEPAQQAQGDVAMQPAAEPAPAAPAPAEAEKAAPEGQKEVAAREDKPGAEPGKPGAPAGSESGAGAACQPVVQDQAVVGLLQVHYPCTDALL